jgi:hypothetical protein
MGDQAEGIYQLIEPLGKTIRFGWNRPKHIDFKKLPTVLRHKPDFYAEQGHLVEVVGLGQDGILKSIKTDKWEALKTWAKIARLLQLNLTLFVWNSSENQYAILKYQQIQTLIRRSMTTFGIQKFEVDGKEYHPIPWEWIIEKAIWVEEYVPEKK